MDKGLMDKSPSNVAIWFTRTKDLWRTNKGELGEISIVVISEK